MKSLVLAQLVLLFLALLAGALVSNGYALEISKYHGLVARLATLTVLITLITSFLKKFPASLKFLSFFTLIFTGLASYGGAAFSASGDALFFYTMVLSGVVSFILTLALLKVIPTVKR